MSRTVYGIGGYRPAHPSQGRVEEHDDDTATVTRWDDEGTQIESRQYTVEETALAAAVAAETVAAVNRATIEQRAAAFLTATATYLAIASPTNAQNAAQVRRNAQALVGLVKLALNDLDDVDGTG